MAKVIFKTTMDLSRRTRLGVLLTRLSQRTAPIIHRSITTTTQSFQTSLTDLSPKNGLHLDRTELMGKRVYLQTRQLSSGSNDEDESNSPDQHSSPQPAKERFQSVKILLDEASLQNKRRDPFDFSDVPQRTNLVTENHKTSSGRKSKQDPREMSTFLFPGQGSQFVGMGRDLLKYPNVKDMFSIASDILGYDLLDLCLNGTQEELNRTIHSQPAVVVCSLAAVEKLKEEQPKLVENCVSAAGFSVGEFSALVFSGALDFEDAIQLIKIRAEAMQRASDVVPSGMLHVIGRASTRFKMMCREAADSCLINGQTNAMCMIASHVYPEAKVVAGNEEALNYIQEMSHHYSLRSAKRVAVSGAFHSPLMAPAQEIFSSAIEKVAFETPVISVHSNVNGKKYRHSKHIRSLLKRHILEPVHWEQTMHEVYQRNKGDHFPKTLEVGPGKQLGAFLRRNNAKAYHSYEKVEV
ncbi:malonyl-CoA-acyl carrier protein transacylase, mitochondrial-like [Asterias amurensis]|uniref:malonyl-CoA-acyl carrier protein transacylase, mitochondrial-like n=1 Tax=Asterias amurensis TaxID=7602 RepID=UPI003AB7767F